MHLGVAKPAAVGLDALVGHEHLVVGDLLESLELEGLDQVSVRPAALEVGRAVDPRIWRAVELEVLGQDLLEDAWVPGLVGRVAVADGLYAVSHAAPCRREVLDRYEHSQAQAVRRASNGS